MHPDTPVVLPHITAAQRQTLIALLDSIATGYNVDARRRSDAVRLAHALDLHLDAVPAEPPVEEDPARAYLLGKHRTAGNTAPRCEHPDHIGPRTERDQGCTGCTSGNAAPGIRTLHDGTEEEHTRHPHMGSVCMTPANGYGGYDMGGYDGTEQRPR